MYVYRVSPKVTPLLIDNSFQMSTIKAIDKLMPVNLLNRTYLLRNLQNLIRQVHIPYLYELKSSKFIYIGVSYNSFTSCFDTKLAEFCFCKLKVSEFFCRNKMVPNKLCRGVPTNNNALRETILNQLYSIYVYPKMHL